MTAIVIKPDRFRGEVEVGRIELFCFGPRRPETHKGLSLCGVAAEVRESERLALLPDDVVDERSRAVTDRLRDDRDLNFTCLVLAAFLNPKRSTADFRFGTLQTSQS